MAFLLLMPSYNQARYIAEAVKSVLAQDDPDWELWIVDNSTDATPEVMRRYTDPRIRFHHIPQRMDPGSCLNWMLERAQGECFSYVHTDNNLRPDYVSSMRRALAGKPMGLAYCDMRVINDYGLVTRIHRRGAFDLGRLFSIDTLGVPFAATRQLERAVGGFRANDLADDVRFCVSAYGLAEYVHLEQPLLDYRLHEQSRTTDSGMPRIRQAFLDMFLELRPQLAGRGVPDPVPGLARGVTEKFEALEDFIETLWRNWLSRVLSPWWTEGRAVDHLFYAGFIRVPGFTGTQPKPPLKPFIRGRDGRIAAGPVRVYAAAVLRSLRRVRIYGLGDRLQHYLLPWAYLVSNGKPQRFRVARADFRNLVAARQLQYALGWQPTVAPGAQFPPWIEWPAATGAEPLLEFGDIPRLVPPP